jgi:hypothetical protein
MAAESTTGSLPGSRCLFVCLALAPDSQLLEERHHGAPVGEGGLQQIQADEGGEQEPVGRVVTSKQDAQQDEETRHPSQISFNHAILPPNIRLSGLFAGPFLQARRPVETLVVGTGLLDSLLDRAAGAGQ